MFDNIDHSLQIHLRNDICASQSIGKIPKVYTWRSSLSILRSKLFITQRRKCERLQAFEHFFFDIFQNNFFFMYLFNSGNFFWVFKRRVKCFANANTRTHSLDEKNTRQAKNFDIQLRKMILNFWFQNNKILKTSYFSQSNWLRFDEDNTFL